jgi:hypothetical protein
VQLSKTATAAELFGQLHLDMRVVRGSVGLGVDFGRLQLRRGSWMCLRPALADHLFASR